MAANGKKEENIVQPERERLREREMKEAIIVKIGSDTGKLMSHITL